jgi:hypothetical protein
MIQRLRLNSSNLYGQSTSEDKIEQVKFVKKSMVD